MPRQFIRRRSEVTRPPLMLDQCLANIGSVLAPALPPEKLARLRERLGEIDWPLTLSLARRHLVTPALHVGLRDKGLVAAMDVKARLYLHAAHRINETRNRRIMAQLSEAVAVLNSVDIRPVLLKGNAHLHLGLYSDPGFRFMNDCDLLVPRTQLRDAVRVLRAIGYQGRDLDQVADYRHNHPPLRRDGAPAVIELHYAVVVPRWAHVLPAEDVIATAQPVSVGAGEALVPAPIHLALHNFVHSQFSHENYLAAQFDLRDAVDFVLIRSRWPESVDWHALLQRLPKHRGHGALAFYANSACALLHASMPNELPITLGARIARWRWQQYSRGRHLWLHTATCVLSSECRRLSWRLVNTVERRRFLPKLMSPAWYKGYVARLRARIRHGQ